MDYKLKLFILACTITGSLSILCEYCSSNISEESAGFPYNCSAPGIRNCTGYDNEKCIQGTPNYDNCTRDSVLSCYNASLVYTDENGVQQVGQLRSCGFPSSADALVCSQDTCNDAISTFNQTNNTLISCSADCCFSDSCNQGAAPSIPSSSAPTNIINTTDGPTVTTSTMSTNTISHGAPSSMVKVSCPYFVGLLWLGVVSLL